MKVKNGREKSFQLLRRLVLWQQPYTLAQLDVSLDRPRDGRRTRMRMRTNLVTLTEARPTRSHRCSLLEDGEWWPAFSGLERPPDDMAQHPRRERERESEAAASVRGPASLLLLGWPPTYRLKLRMNIGERSNKRRWSPHCCERKSACECEREWERECVSMYKIEKGALKVTGNFRLS